MVWSSADKPTDAASSLKFSSQPFYVGSGGPDESFGAGSAQLDWNGKGNDGTFVGTGDYLVKLVVTEQGGGTKVYTKTLTVILQSDKSLSLAKFGPNPATDHLVIDLSAEPNGSQIEISIWNMAGELILRSIASGGAKAGLALKSSQGAPLSDGIYLLQLRTTQTDPRLEDRRIMKLVIMRR